MAELRVLTAPSVPPRPSAFIRRLGRSGAIQEGDLQALGRAMGPAQTLLPHEDSLSEGDCVKGCTVVLEGLLCRYKMLPDGKRQILSFLIAGDTYGLSATILGQCDHSIAAVTFSRVATIPQPKLRELFSSRPRIAHALWLDMLVQDSISREWLTNVGQRKAYSRISHLLCEMWVRCEAAGLAVNGRFTWPITQADIGDAAGLSIVHVNRTLQRLRAEGLIKFSDGEVTIHDWATLKQIAGFDPAYLYLGDRSGIGMGLPLV